MQASSRHDRKTITVYLNPTCHRPETLTALGVRVRGLALCQELARGATHFFNAGKTARFSAVGKLEPTKAAASRRTPSKKGPRRDVTALAHTLKGGLYHRPEAPRQPKGRPA